MKLLISAAVGTVILFVWFALSWVALPIHTNALKYTEGQDEIIEVLAKHLEEDGMFFIPYYPPDADAATKEGYAASVDGQPTALVNFNAAYNNGMGKTMGVGVLIYFFSSLIISFIIAKSRSNLNGFGGRWIMVMAIGALLFIMGTAPYANWWSFPASWIIPELIDTVVAFVLLGLWMAWYWGRDLKPE